MKIAPAKWRSQMRFEVADAFWNRSCVLKTHLRPELRRCDFRIAGAKLTSQLRSAARLWHLLDKEAPMGEVVELESGIEPLSIIFINIRRHSVLSCWFCPLWNISWRTNWNLSASTSFELQALCAVCNRHFKRVPSVLELKGEVQLLFRKIEKINWRTE